MSIKPAIKNKKLFHQATFVGGKWIPAKGKHVIEVINPYDGKMLGVVPNVDKKRVVAAINHAHKAFDGWRKLTAADRSKLMQRWFELIMANQKDIATIMTLEQGKPLAETMGEVAYAANFVEWFAGEAKRAYGKMVPPHVNNGKIIVSKEPIGVCASITPWNFPAAMITRKVAPALAVGCTVVVKPASATPFTALALAHLAQEAGFPAGVLNVVTGDADVVGETLSTHPVVKKVSFTGSTAVGKRILANGAATVKKVSLELGGNAPFIVFDDADVDAAVAGVMLSKFRNSGQTCVCANRVIVHHKIQKAFTAKLLKAVKQLKLGSGLKKGVDQGPLINQAALDKIESLIANAVKQGAKVLTGGKPASKIGKTFFQPTVLSKVTADMTLACEEIFGPVLPIITFKTEEEAIRIANSTNYGLAGYFYSRDLSRAWRVADAMEVGMVAVNAGHMSTPAAPFGGVKESGIGREGSYMGIEEYLETKYIFMNIN